MAHHASIAELLRIAARWEPFLLQLPADFGDRMAGSEWNVREMLGHLVDSSHFHRTLWLELCTGDVWNRTPYDQDAWVRHSGWHRYPWQDLVRLWGAGLRLMANLIDGLPEAALEHVWRDKERSLEQLLSGFADHQNHHLKAIEKALA